MPKCKHPQATFRGSTLIRCKCQDFFMFFYIFPENFLT